MNGQYVSAQPLAERRVYRAPLLVKILLHQLRIFLLIF